MGYKWAGYKELLAIDFEKNAVQSFKANFPEVSIWERDIRGVAAEEILNFCNIERGELSIFDGSPPCQGFSTAGKRRIGDIRNELSFEYIRLVDGLQPKVFVMENVAGLAKGKMVGMFNEIISEMQSLNYNVKCNPMNAMYYNVPQSRERLIFIGVRDDLNIEPSFPVPNTNIIPLKNVVPDVEGYHPGVFKRDIHSANRVVCTITKTSSQRFIRNGKEVKPTISEIKKVCSFPEDFKLVGNYDQQWARLGNAVMPKFMQAIAEHIKNNILNTSTSAPLDQLPEPKKYPSNSKVGIQNVAPIVKKIKLKRQPWKPSLTSQFRNCPIPYHLDTYRGCVYNCRYCFARDLVTFARRKSDNKSFSYLIGNRADLLDKWIQRILEKNYDYTNGSEVAFKERIPIKIGANADPFPPIESKEHITYDILKVFDKYDYPLEIQTKNPVGLVEYMKDFKNPNWIIAVSLISTDEEFIKIVEPGAPTAKNRLDAIKQLTDYGIPVMVKIQPSIYPKVIEDIQELTIAIKEAGCWAFNMEGLKIRITMPQSEQKLYTELSDFIGFDIIEYTKRQKKNSSDWELSAKKKIAYTQYAQILADKHNLTFFSADAIPGFAGFSSECCGTEKLRDYKILGCNTWTQKFPNKPSHASKHLEKVYVNFTRSKKNRNKTIGEVCDEEMCNLCSANAIEKIA